MQHMDLSGHTVKKASIEGIGPLMIKESADEAERVLYQSKQLYYIVHLRHQSIKIESPWYRIIGISPDETKKNNQDFAAWKAGYGEAREHIIQLINSDLP